MTRKIRTISIVAIILIIVAGLVAIYEVEGKNIKPVEEVSISADKDNGAKELTWSAVSKADGYKVLCSENGGEFEKLITVDKSNHPKCDLDNLKPAKKYQFKVQAFKYFNSKTIESEVSKAVEYVSLPENVTFAKAQSTVLGMVNLTWKVVDATGYDIQYTTSDFDTASDVKTVKIANSKTSSYDVDGLEKDQKYSFRIRARFNADSKNYYSEWSETKDVTVVSKSVVDKNKKMVALTFDDGPNYSTTTRIVNVLEKYGAHATFFMVGNRITGNNKDLIKRELKIGCELGNHTYDHEHYGSQVNATDITKCNDVIKSITGSTPTAFRCPGGEVTNTIRNACNAPIFYWSLDTEDWKTRNAKSTISAVLNHVSDGDIILMHDIYDASADAAETIIPELVKRGYQLVTVNELFEAKGVKLQNGKQYYSSSSTYNGK